MSQFQRDRFRSEYSPMPPATRSQRVGSRSRSARMGGPGGKKPKKGLAKFFTWKWLLLVLLTSLLLVVGGCSAIMSYGEQIDLEKLNNIKSSSEILDAQGKPIGTIGDFKREYVNLEDVKKVNPMLPKAFVKVEDVRFYDHSGVDFKALARAVWAVIESGGKPTQGGGTITMQVARNVILEDNDKNITRKIKEIATAWNIERKYEKDKILEAYLNYIYFGNGVNGIKMAAKVYFNKDITKDKLTPAEIALLAGMPQAPSQYDPFGNEEQKKAAEDRREIVLDEMAEDNEMEPLISQEEADKAKKEPLTTTQAGLKYAKTNDQFAAYKKLVVDELRTRFGIDENKLRNYTLKVETGLNQQAQAATNRVLADDKYYRGYKQLNAGTATIDLKTGLIAAIGGGRNYQVGGLVKGGYEFRQPGSSIKPLTVYAPAIEKGNGEVNEYYKVPDEKITIGGWTPRNASGQYYGEVSMGYVVKKSLNAGTAWLLKNKVGLDDSYSYATEKLGLPLTDKDQNYPALALGGLDKGVTPLQLARAYTSLARDGEMVHAYAIKRVIDVKTNEEIKPESDKEIKKKKVFEPKTAWWMTRMLIDVVKDQDGTGHDARLAGGRPVAGKTGTTNENKVAWFAGYTPEYVTTVMVYNESSDESDRVEALSGGKIPARIFKAIMDETLEGQPVSEFKAPPGVQDPTPPFQLEKPRLSGHYDANSNTVYLSWQQQRERVKYEVYRSDDGGQTFNMIGEAPGGSTGFSDNSVQPPQGGGDFFDGFFGGGQEKSYIYKVVAVDTMAENGEEAKKESDLLRVTVKPKKDDKKDDENKDQGQNGQDNEGDNQDSRDGQQGGDFGNDNDNIGNPGGDFGDTGGDSTGDSSGGDNSGDSSGGGKKNGGDTDGGGIF
ncbi:transglycosylase domain-containing protein [Lihuaxuella thermophila]|uniref:Penicillin-binding protein 2A n=1 Tax=Lihuaxuella thermophila TaxID=1173111 RepID=A0A1H8C9F8_9BACL|nr:transglycosylase domain-containing protein [Lihuaxuella thermophila]SEM90878.1 penicillin-binding protein 2A [Lihuaxuella thermophila]